MIIMEALVIETSDIEVEGEYGWVTPINKEFEDVTAYASWIAWLEGFEAVSVERGEILAWSVLCSLRYADQ